METDLLEAQARIAAREAGVADYTWNRFLYNLAPLREHNLVMYAHSLRVGLYAYGLAAEEHQEDLRLPLLGGCGHDLGKCRVPNEILDKTAPLSAGEFEVIHRHPEDGYLMLRDEFPFAAMVAGLHHKFTPKAYGIDLADAPPWLHAAHAHKIIEATMLVMICDFYDAMTTRKNSATVVDAEDHEAVALFMKQMFPDFAPRCEWLALRRI